MDGKEGGGGGGMGGTVTSKLRRLQKGGSTKQERPVTMPPQISSMEPTSSSAAKPGKDLPKEGILFNIYFLQQVKFNIIVTNMAIIVIYNLPIFSNY